MSAAGPGSAASPSPYADTPSPASGYQPSPSPGSAYTAPSPTGGYSPHTAGLNPQTPAGGSELAGLDWLTTDIEVQSADRVTDTQTHTALTTDIEVQSATESPTHRHTQRGHKHSQPPEIHTSAGPSHRHTDIHSAGTNTVTRLRYTRLQGNIPADRILNSCRTD